MALNIVSSSVWLYANKTAASAELPADKVSILSSDEHINVEADSQVTTQ